MRNEIIKWGDLMLDPEKVVRKNESGHPIEVWNRCMPSNKGSSSWRIIEDLFVVAQEVIRE